MGKNIFSFVFFALCIVAGVYLLSLPPAQKTPQISSLTPTPSSIASSYVLGVRTKTVDCQIRNAFPDPECTPGAVFPDVTKEQVCTPGYSASVRDVSVSLKKDVYTEYGLDYPQPRGAYEADHHIPLELGGSNDIANLWPEAADPTPGFHQKDAVENYLHKEVCEGRMSLQAAQTSIAQNWYMVYKQMQQSR